MRNLLLIENWSTIHYGKSLLQYLGSSHYQFSPILKIGSVFRLDSSMICAESLFFFCRLISMEDIIGKIRDDVYDNGLDNFVKDVKKIYE